MTQREAALTRAALHLRSWMTENGIDPDDIELVLTTADDSKRQQVVDAFESTVASRKAALSYSDPRANLCGPTWMQLCGVVFRLG